MMLQLWSVDRTHRWRGRRGVWIAFGAALAVCLTAGRATAQERRAVVFGDIGGASIGHADSEQGKAPIFGGGLAFHLTPHIVLEGDVHGGHVENVFGRADHDFTHMTMTGSILFRARAQGPVHFVAGGGVAVQRAHIEFNEPPLSPVDRTETLRLLHGRIGADWDLSDRLVLRTHAVLWMGSGLDWVFGGRAGLGYRF
jgi:hypothetical protein